MKTCPASLRVLAIWGSLAEGLHAATRNGRNITSPVATGQLPECALPIANFPHGDQPHGRRALCDQYLGIRSLASVSPGLSAPVLLSIVGVALLFVSGWPGSQMVDVYGVGVGGRNIGTAAAIPRSGE